MVIREARSADASAIARVHVETWRSAYAGIVREDVLANMSLQRCEMGHRAAIGGGGQGCWTLVAEEEAAAGVVGFARGGAERCGNAVFRGEIYALYVLAEHQRRGIGRALVAAVAAELLAHGMHSVLIWALKENPSRGFYENLGGRYVGEKEVTIGGDSLVEVAYGWEDIRPLARATDRSSSDASTAKGDAPCSEQ